MHKGPFVSYLPTVYNYTTFQEFLYYFSNLNVMLAFCFKALSLSGVDLQVQYCLNDFSIFFTNIEAKSVVTTEVS